MTKADIVERIYDKVGFSKKESAELVEMVFDILKNPPWKKATRLK